MENCLAGAGLFQIWRFHPGDFLHTLPVRGKKKSGVFACVALLVLPFSPCPALSSLTSLEGQVWFSLPCDLLRTKVALFWKVQYVCSKYKGNKIYSLLLWMATWSHYKLFLQLCLVIACFCFYFAFFFNLKPEHSLSFWVSYIFCILRVDFSRPSVASCLRRRKDSVGWPCFPPASACPCSCCVAGPGSRQRPLCVHRLVMRTNLPCKNRGALGTPEGFECWMLLMSYLHTWLCDKVS